MAKSERKERRGTPENRKFFKYEAPIVGYNQHLCPDGHYWEGTSAFCPHCGQVNLLSNWVSGVWKGPGEGWIPVHQLEKSGNCYNVPTMKEWESLRTTRKNNLRVFRSTGEAVV